MGRENSCAMAIGNFLPLLVGLRCPVLILSYLAAFSCVRDCWLNCASPALALCSVCCFWYPYLGKGSWSWLMMMKDTCKKQSALLHQEQSRYLGHSRGPEPFASISALLQGASQAVRGELSGETQHITEMCTWELLTASRQIAAGLRNCRNTLVYLPP